MKKMIVMDMDGTLLHLDKSCSIETANYLNNLKEKGYIIVLASGRNLNAILKPTYNSFFANYIIADAGALIYDADKSFIIFKTKISKENVEAICSCYDKNTMEEITLVDTEFYNKYTLDTYKEREDCYFIKNKEDLERISNNSIHMSVSVKDNSYINEVISLLKAKTKNLDFNIMQDSFNSKKWVEISNKKISKASAIKKVALLEKIDSNNIICFGDGLNDIDMLEYCGVSVAMGNALEEVKNVCKYITDTNDNDGIVRFLEKYLDNKDKVVHE